MNKIYATLLATVISSSLWASAALAAQTTPVDLKEGGKSYKGTLVYPDHAKGSLPLVLVVHEWWGKTEYPEMRARKIADELGYAALAVDLFGEGKTGTTPPEATELAGPFYKDPMIGVKLLQQFAAAAPTAAKKAGFSIDSAKIAAIGYCFGGSQVLNLARAGGLTGKEKLLGVVSFHGALESSLKAKSPIKPQILVLTGAADPMVDAKKVEEFKEEMKKDKAQFDVISYPGAKHAFTNQKATELGNKYKMPIAYNAEADADSWQKMKTFLSKIFSK
ncbi:MAG: dienelactone hydrolase family protein [Bdellovibrionia bacterium]